jgi:predicted ATPase
MVDICYSVAMITSTQFPDGYIRSIAINKDSSRSHKYPYSIPAIKQIESIALDAKITFFVGENGSGKSTFVEAIALAAGFNSEGGTKNFSFTTRDSVSPLHQAIRLVRNSQREKDGFFLRAESFYNVATNIEDLDKGFG